MNYYDLSRYENERDFFTDEDFEKITKKNISSYSHWYTSFSQVFRYKDGTFWEASWTLGTIEYLETDLELSLVQVEPYQIEITKYRVIK